MFGVRRAKNILGCFDQLVEPTISTIVHALMLGMKAWTIVEIVGSIPGGGREQWHVCLCRCIYRGS